LNPVTENHAPQRDRTFHRIITDEDGNKISLLCFADEDETAEEAVERIRAGQIDAVAFSFPKDLEGFAF
jgi:phage head maturation protease